MRFFYLRDERNNPVGCVATFKHYNRVFFGVSTWNSDMDKYDANAARSWAAERVNENGDFVLINTAPNPMVFRRILQSISTNDKFPRKTRKAAGYMLKSWVRQVCAEQQIKRETLVPKLALAKPDWDERGGIPTLVGGMGQIFALNTMQNGPPLLKLFKKIGNRHPRRGEFYLDAAFDENYGKRAFVDCATWDMAVDCDIFEEVKGVPLPDAR